MFFVWPAIEVMKRDQYTRLRSLFYACYVFFIKNSLFLCKHIDILLHCSLN